MLSNVGWSDGGAERVAVGAEGGLTVKKGRLLSQLDQGKKKQLLQDLRRIDRLSCLSEGPYDMITTAGEAADNHMTTGPTLQTQVF